jgi:hypothetical protein
MPTRRDAKVISPTEASLTQPREVDPWITDECRKRGDRCRALEAQERQALADLATARAEVRSQADPQAQALRTDSNTVRIVQAAAMVGMCLCAGYLIAFGAGLIWRRI